MVAKSPELFKEVLGKALVDVWEEGERVREERVRGVVMELEGFEVGTRIRGIEVENDQAEKKVVEGSGEERVLIAT
jgi:hypothetical protein